MGIIDQFNDKQFSEIIKNSKTWKEIGEKLGYKNTISSNNKQNTNNSYGGNHPQR